MLHTNSLDVKNEIMADLNSIAVALYEKTILEFKYRVLALSAPKEWITITYSNIPLHNTDSGYSLGAQYYQTVTDIIKKKLITDGWKYEIKCFVTRTPSIEINLKCPTL